MMRSGSKSGGESLSISNINVVDGEGKEKKEKMKNSNDAGSVTLLLCIFCFAMFSIYSIYSTFPSLQDDEKALIKLPRDISDAKALGRVLHKYSQTNFYSVLFAFMYTYILLQTFAIPGSIFLSILSGFLYPFPLAIFCVCFCSSTGAMLCYILSHAFARRLLMRVLSNRLTEWRQVVERKKSDMLFYIVFLRVTPIVPNWFINLASPLLDIDAFPFVFGTFIGVAPPSCLYIQAGTTLNTLTSTSAILSPQYFVLLIFFALVSLLPVIFKNYLRKKME